jgi:hypothetical protein
MMKGAFVEQDRHRAKAIDQRWTIPWILQPSIVARLDNGERVNFNEMQNEDVWVLPSSPFMSNSTPLRSGRIEPPAGPKAGDLGSKGGKSQSDPVTTDSHTEGKGKRVRLVERGQQEQGPTRSVNYQPNSHWNSSSSSSWTPYDYNAAGANSSAPLAGSRAALSGTTAGSTAGAGEDDRSPWPLQESDHLSQEPHLQPSGFPHQAAPARQEIETAWHVAGAHHSSWAGWWHRELWDHPGTAAAKADRPNPRRDYRAPRDGPY